jgi:hypothetical protein
MDDLDTQIAEAGGLDDPAARLRLAHVIAAFLGAQGDNQGFTPEEMAHLRVIDAEPFRPADPAEVAALFRPRG